VPEYRPETSTRASVIGRHRFARSPLIALYSATSGAAEGRSRLFEKGVMFRQSARQMCWKADNGAPSRADAVQRFSDSRQTAGRFKPTRRRGEVVFGGPLIGWCALVAAASIFPLNNFAGTPPRHAA
jgi:hypothetical protein